MRFAVQHQRFQLAVGGQQDGAAGGLVHAVRFHPHQAVLDQVDAADAVLPADLVEHCDQIWPGESVWPLTATGVPHSNSIST